MDLDGSFGHESIGEYQDMTNIRFKVYLANTSIVTKHGHARISLGRGTLL